MRSWSTVTVALATVCALQAGFIAGRALPAAAYAQEPEPAAPSVECRVFATELAQGGFDVDLGDRTEEIGRWVRDRTDSGGIVTTIDFEVGQKATGYPQGWVQVCATR